MSRVAAVDCGTNSLRLLVADVDAGAGVLTTLDRRMEIVRLGQGVDRTGRLAPEALARTLAALATYARRADELGAQRVRMVATSATRDAANRDEFVRGVEQVLGVPPEVISGAEEAELSLVGATRGLPGVRPPHLVVDIGGGSTELVLGTDGAVVAARSVDVGCVRLTERHFSDDPPTPQQVAAARADVDAALDVVAASVPLGDARSLVGVAGSVTTVAGIALGLPAYDADAIHHSRIPADDVRRVTDRLLRQTCAERLGEPVMHPGRADVIAAGALVLERVVARVGLPEVVVSEHDILDGIAWSVA
jgi:exopolyphosphatase/guanosine-5'-triphosphate,3'-diphosphate pyrophosphatase